MKNKNLRKEAIAIQARAITLSLAAVFLIYLTFSMSPAAAQGGPGSWDDPHFDINFQLKPGEYIAADGVRFAKIKIQVLETGSFTLNILAGNLAQNAGADLDATDGSATIYIPTGTYNVYVQARGKPGGSMDFFLGGMHTRSNGKSVWSGPHSGGAGTYSGITNSGLHNLSTRWYYT